MLEALISLMRDEQGAIGGAESATSKVGDFICVQKVGSAIWGNREMKEDFLIALYKDDALEASMGEKTKKVLPYAVTEDIETPFGTESATINQSGRRVDISMFEGSDGLDPEVSCGAVAPNGKEYLDVSDTILDESGRVA